MEEFNDPVAFAREFLNSPVLTNDVDRHPPAEQDCQHLAAELQRASNDPDTNDYDVLSNLAVFYLREGQQLPDWLAIFAADVLEGKKKRPTKRGKDKYDNWERDYKLFRATQEVAEAYNLPHYYNNELNEKITAAKIVAHAAGCSVDTVINCYKRFSSLGVK